MQPYSPQILTIIPARMASTRLPGKPLADIGGTPMIVRVWQQAVKADLGPVIVACAEPEIQSVIEQAGGIAILTPPDLPSGSDRVLAAADKFDPSGDYKIIINLQGDMPLIAPEIIAKTAAGFSHFLGADIITAVTPFGASEDIHNPNSVKAVLSAEGRALHFSRRPVTHGAGKLLHHVGIYAYRRAALARFCSLPPSLLEQAERLEQLRALEDGMLIYAVEIGQVPAGVDTPDDLERAREICAKSI